MGVVGQINGQINLGYAHDRKRCVKTMARSKRENEEETEEESAFDDEHLNVVEMKRDWLG